MGCSLSRFADTTFRGVRHQVVALQDFDSCWSEQSGTSWSWARGSAKLCTWRRTTLCTRTDWAEVSWLESSCAEKDLGVLAAQLTPGQHCPVSAKGPAASWAALDWSAGHHWVGMVSRFYFYFESRYILVMFPLDVLLINWKYPKS